MRAHRSRRSITAVTLGVAAALVCSCGTANGALLLSSSGSGPEKTSIFDPTSAWSVSYQWDCTAAALRNKAAQPGFSWDMLNADDQTLVADSPHVSVKGIKGKGTVKYPMSGAYTMSITSACQWVVQVRGQS